jgi:hypothetical protein
VNPSVGIRLREQGGPYARVAVAMSVVVILAIIVGITSVYASSPAPMASGVVEKMTTEVCGSYRDQSLGG